MPASAGIYVVNVQHPVVSPSNKQHVFSPGNSLRIVNRRSTSSSSSLGKAKQRPRSRIFIKSSSDEGSTNDPTEDQEDLAISPTIKEDVSFTEDILRNLGISEETNATEEDVFSEENVALKNEELCNSDDKKCENNKKGEQDTNIFCENKMSELKNENPMWTLKKTPNPIWTLKEFPQTASEVEGLPDSKTEDHNTNQHNTPGPLNESVLDEAISSKIIKLENVSTNDDIILKNENLPTAKNTETFSFPLPVHKKPSTSTFEFTACYLKESFVDDASIFASDSEMSDICSDLSCEVTPVPIRKWNTLDRLTIESPTSDDTSTARLTNDQMSDIIGEDMRRNDDSLDGNNVHNDDNVITNRSHATTNGHIPTSISSIDDDIITNRHRHQNSTPLTANGETLPNNNVGSDFTTISLSSDISEQGTNRHDNLDSHSIRNDRPPSYSSMPRIDYVVIEEPPRYTETVFPYGTTRSHCECIDDPPKHCFSTKRNKCTKRKCCVTTFVVAAILLIVVTVVVAYFSISN